MLKERAERSRVSMRSLTGRAGVRRVGILPRSICLLHSFFFSLGANATLLLSSFLSLTKIFHTALVLLLLSSYCLVLSLFLSKRSCLLSRRRPRDVQPSLCMLFHHITAREFEISLDSSQPYIPKYTPAHAQTGPRRHLHLHAHAWRRMYTCIYEGSK